MIRDPLTHEQIDIVDDDEAEVRAVGVVEGLDQGLLLSMFTLANECVCSQTLHEWEAAVAGELGSQGCLARPRPAVQQHRSQVVLSQLQLVLCEFLILILIPRPTQARTVLIMSSKLACMRRKGSPQLYAPSRYRLLSAPSISPNAGFVCDQW